MINSVLKQIQNTVVKYANVIASVLQVEIEIVDRNLFRIAGTGIYKDKLNQDISKEGFVYGHVLRTGEQQIIEEPGMHKLCKECKKNSCCDEKMEIATPIRLGDDIIGVIGLFCSNDKQKKHLKSNMRTYLEFLHQIADFISSKAYTYNENTRYKNTINILTQVVDSIDKGVVVVNNNNEIININERASKILRTSRTHFNKTIEIVGTNEYMFDDEIYSVKIGKREMELVGKLIPAFPLYSSYDKIFIFSEIKKGGHDSDSTYIWQAIKLEDIEGKSEAMMQIKEKIKKIGTSSSTVLITGESGTGKEMIARAIHSESDRWNKPFVAINCGAIPENLLESELFGYVRGAFSGADPNGRMGKFELANTGVIFLDEIGDMPLYLQVKILRVLQERKISRIGSNQLMDLDIRVIAATNKDLKKEISENNFREDLYYRLNVIPIELPPLRERKDDIELLLDKTVKKYNAILNTNIRCIEEEAKSILKNYSWPGNIRELENTVEFMINMSDGNRVLTKSTIPEGILNYKPEVKEKLIEIKNQNDSSGIRSLKEIEKEYILKAVKLYGSDTKGKQLAAQKLGIGIATLYRKLEELRLSR